jgi:hypothetical protein
MKTPQQLKDLMFPASKYVDTTQSPVKFRVRGNPRNTNTFTDYANFTRDFYFVSYEDVIAGGLLRSHKLFNKKYEDLEIHKMSYGQNKQWFICEIIAKNTIVKIDGEDHSPFLSISYSYDHVNAINYEIGIYRWKCSNGLLLGMKTLLKIKATPETIFEVDPHYNPCLLSKIEKEYERQVMILKNTELDENAVEALLTTALGDNIWTDHKARNWKRKDGIIHGGSMEQLISDYIGELGQNTYAVLNVITDLASNYYDSEEQETENINKSITTAQRKAGKWLERLINFIETENKCQMITNLEDENFGSRPLIEKYHFDLRKYLQFIKTSK